MVFCVVFEKLMNIRTYGPATFALKDVLLPNQTHGTRIVEIVSGEEDLSACDGVWTRNHAFILGIKTADCASICFWDEERFGIVHAGWRGLVGGICEKMLTLFEEGAVRSLNVFVGPLLPRFEIQKDFCYEMIRSKFGERFFVPFDSVCGGGRVSFDFKGALASVLPMGQFDSRSTFEDTGLASWRRDGGGGRNVTVICRE